MTRGMQLMVAAIVVAAVACGSDSISPLESVGTATKSAGTDTIGGSGGGNNNTVGLVITPSSVTLAVGWYAGLTVAMRDANGRLTPKRATLTSSNPAIVAVVGDTGVVQAKAVGTATITATADGQTAVATVTVTETPPPPPALPPVVSEFSIKIVAMGAIPGSDTARAERVAGATVKIQRTGGVTGDTLKTPIDAGTAVTDANGEVSFAKLPGGSYEIRITPPSGSPYDSGFLGFGPPRSTNFAVNVTLRRR